MSRDSLFFFDSYATLGPTPAKDSAAPWTRDDLLNEMERCQVRGALVYTYQAALVHPKVGNPVTLDLCRDSDRLFPCWVGLPHHTGEVPDPQTFVQQMEEADVRAVKLFPRTHAYQVDEPTLGELCSVLSEAGKLLILDAGEGAHAQIDWPELSWICETYPRLNVLVHNIKWGMTRHLVPIADRFANLHIEFSNYQGNRMLEFWSDRIGHERLLFGSGALAKSMGAARAYIDYSDLTDDQRQAIAGGNLMRLLGLSERSIAPAYTDTGSTDSIRTRALRGEPIEDMEVIDAHAHLVEKDGRGASHVAMNAADGPSVVERNRALGVNKTCVSAWNAIWCDYESGHQDTLDTMQECPDEIVGYAVMHPTYVTDWERELRTVYEEQGFMGMKPYYPMWRIPYNDPRFDPWYEYGNQHHLFCLLHMSDNFKAEVTDLAARYPNINFLLAHSAVDWGVVREHVDLAKAFGNVYLELTFTSVLSGSIEHMVREVGSERVLYGSDAPMRDPYPQFGWVVYADITEEDKRNILGRNMRNILDQVRLPGRR
jgi:predicted TIM-barrel fold metal-dependent hydrolase